jgi:hypothetical protein
MTFNGFCLLGLLGIAIVIYSVGSILPDDAQSAAALEDAR